jgi:hypothetical protein
MQTARLLVFYLLILVIGILFVVANGLLLLDQYLRSMSVTISIVLYFAVIFFGWKLAVRLTAPRHQ